MRRIALAIATAGGAGYVPFAPGTVGSAVGLVLHFLVRALSPLTQLIIVGAIIAVGIWASTEAARHFKRDDPGHVVIDEVAGQLVTLLLLNVGIIGTVVGFLVFRVLDIIKPWPANRFEALPGGTGIMADDLMAGAYGWIIMRVTVMIVPGV